ncbi:MAG: hypothetical protein H7232_09940 [Aeromicrobium sp.]|nr:hypothetical protein [Burkholderiales bacterium]
MFLSIAVAMFSGSVDAQAARTANVLTQSPMSVQTAATKITGDTLVITATRLK